MIQLASSPFAPAALLTTGGAGGAGGGAGGATTGVGTNTGGGVGTVAICTGGDNCPLVGNNDQTNGDIYEAGDACQCGDVTGDGTITPLDYTRAREIVTGRTPSGPAEVNKCDVTGDADCHVEDLAVLDRLVQGAQASIVYGCEVYTDQ